MKKGERVFSLGLLLFALFYSYKAVQIPKGGFSQPGPGLFPLILAILVTLIALIIMIGTFREKGSGSQEVDSEDKFANQNGGKKLDKGLVRALSYIGIIAISLFFFEYLGAVITTFILVVILLKVGGQPRWLFPIFVGIACSAVLYIVFSKIFDIYLPLGIFSSFL